MPKNDIGGFFVSLGLAVDKPSFETGNKLIDGVTTGLSKMIATARNAAVVLTGTAVATGVVESSAYKTAAAIGITTEALDLWKASAKIAGVDANGLISAMSKMSDVMNHMTIDGSGLEAYTEQLGKLGLITDDVDIEKLLKLSPDELMLEILSKAHSAVAGGMDIRKASTIVGDILGDSGQNFFIELERQGKSPEEFLSGALETVFTSGESNMKAADFAVQVNTLKTELQSISKLLGSEVGGAMTPYLKGVADWIKDNADDIKDGITNISSFVEKILGKINPVAQDAGSILSATLKLINGDKAGALNALKQTSIGQGITSVRDINTAIEKYRKDNGSPKDIKFSDLPEDVQLGILSYYANGGNKTWTPGYVNKESLDRAKTNAGLNDGIIRPDGTITPVAQDDWVFAARSLGDMARAFTPTNYTAATSNEFVINQTFNISGGNDMPQVLRQQAYRGTQEGMQEVMLQSSRRLQLMPGTM